MPNLVLKLHEHRHLCGPPWRHLHRHHQAITERPRATAGRVRVLLSFADKLSRCYQRKAVSQFTFDVGLIRQIRRDNRAKGAGKSAGIGAGAGGAAGLLAGRGFTGNPGSWTGCRSGLAGCDRGRGCRRSSYRWYCRCAHRGWRSGRGCSLLRRGRPRGGTLVSARVVDADRSRLELNVERACHQPA